MNKQKLTGQTSQAVGRRRLLRASIKLFAEKGYAGTSLREIASEAGVSFGLIRIHFGSKEDLRKAVDAEVLSRVEELYLTVLDHSAEEALQRVSEDAETWILQNTDALMYARTSFLEASEGGQAFFKQLLTTMRRFLTANDQKGFLHYDVDREWAALYLVFDFIGPAVLEPFSEKELGYSMYSKTAISRRNQFMKQLFSRGIYQTQNS